jgi:phosphoenolpyruvate carboxylase
VPDLPISRTDQIKDKLLVLHRSLTETGQELIADGLLTDTIRRCGKNNKNKK